MSKFRLPFLKYPTAKWINFALVTIITIVGQPLHAQYQLKHYKVKDGLPQTQISSLVEDSLGYLWVGTFGGGLGKFNGTHFTTYNVPFLKSNTVRDLLATSQGLWIATQGELSILNGDSIRQITIDSTKTIFPTKLFNHGDSVFCMLNNNSLAYVWNNSLQDYRGTVFKKINQVVKTSFGLTALHQTSNLINEIIILDDNNILCKVRTFGSRIYSLFRFGNDIQLSTDIGLFTLRGNKLEPSHRLDFPVASYDSTSQTYFGLRDYKFVTIPLENNAIAGVIKEVSDARLLVSTYFKDKEGITWLGTDIGLMKIYPKNFDRVLTTPPIDFPVMAIFERNDTTWIGTTSQGLKLYHKNKLINEFNFGTPQKNYVSIIQQGSNGTIWIGTAGGLAAFQKGKINWIAPDAIKNTLTLGFDEDGTLISGGLLGTYRIENDGITTIIPEFKNTLVLCLSKKPDSNEFAVGTNIGLKFLNKNIVKDESIPGLKGVEISCIEWITNDLIGIGTFGKGVLFYSLSKKTLRALDQSNGLSSNTIYILKNAPGGVWIGTDKGINFMGVSPNYRNVEKLIFYGEPEGLDGIETNLNSIHQIDDSTFQFGLVNGLYLFRSPKREKPLYPVHIVDVQLFYKESVLGKDYYRKADGKHIFSNEQNHLTFTYNKVDKLSEALPYFTYKLEGLDSVWSSPSTSKSASFINVPPGNYRFWVVSCDASGSLMYDQIYFDFTITPAFYQTFTFQLFSILLTIAFLTGVGYLFYRAKLRRTLLLKDIQEQEKTKLRKEIARDFHDELGNQIARMINYVSILKIKENLNDTIYKNLQTHSQQILRGTKDFIWALDPGNDEISHIIIHLKDFGEQMFSEKSIAFRFHGELPSQLRLPMGYSRQINLIFKEAMTNAFTHSQATCVDFTVEIEPSKIIISLRDDGIGVAQDLIDRSERGLDNMKTRAKKIEGDLLIIRANPGTLIQLTLQLKYSNYRNTPIG